MVAPSVRKQSERLINLLFALRNTEKWMSKAQIREHVEGYDNLSDVAFNRMFERDKAALRGIGINISITGWNNRASEDVVYGYRITDDDYALKPVTFTPAEAEVVRAASAWMPQSAPAMRAITKLTGLGLDLVHPRDQVPAHAMYSQVTGRFISATDERRPQTFLYRKSGGQPEQRTVFPYGVVTRGPRGYVVGFDVDRQDIRVFRFSRIIGKVKNAPKYREGAYDIPADFSARDYLRADENVEVSLAVQHDRAQSIRTRATSITAVDDTWDTVTVDVTDVNTFVSEVLAFGAAVQPEAPQEFVDAYRHAHAQTVAQLKELADG